MGMGLGWRRGADMSAAVVSDPTAEVEALRQKVAELTAAIEELKGKSAEKQ